MARDEEHYDEIERRAARSALLGKITFLAIIIVAVIAASALVLLTY